MKSRSAWSSNEFQASHSYVVRPFLKKIKKKKSQVHPRGEGGFLIPTNSGAEQQKGVWGEDQNSLREKEDEIRVLDLLIVDS